jgi:ATP-dependent Lon protease
MRPDRISLFPLNVVLFPGELLPLHIFEPRYRRMVRECLDAKLEFGMLLAVPGGGVKPPLQAMTDEMARAGGGATLRHAQGKKTAAPEGGVAHVGCSAEILEVTKLYEDGRMDILTVGRQPYRVVELFTDDPLLQGAVDYLADQDSLLHPQDREQLIELYEVCFTLLTSGMPANLWEIAPGTLSFTIASALPLDLMCKQQILELRSEAERQDRLLRYLREWALHLHQTDTLSRRSGGHGQGLN